MASLRLRPASGHLEHRQKLSRVRADLAILEEGSCGQAARTKARAVAHLLT
jgi:hypothetical protein